jgi:hypothetical protein
MIRQLDPPTFLITFTFVKRLNEPIIKVLYTLHVKKLNLSNKMKHLEHVHIKKLIHVNPITCSKYYDHETSCFHTLFNKVPFLGINVQFVFVIDFENHGNEHDHGLLWIKHAPIHGINTIEFFLKTCG